MAKRVTPPPPERPVTRDDLQRGFQSLQDGLKREVSDRKSTLLTVGGGVALLVVVMVFLLGRRSGRRKTTFVEIRRV